MRWYKRVAHPRRPYIWADAFVLALMTPYAAYMYQVNRAYNDYASIEQGMDRADLIKVFGDPARVEHVAGTNYRPAWDNRAFPTGAEPNIDHVLHYTIGFPITHRYTFGIDAQDNVASKTHSEALPF